METSDILQTIETLHGDARRRNLFFQHATDTRLSGRNVTVNGRELVSFGSCSYLGLELHPKLIDAACDAARRFGTQFSCSRGYLSAPLYDELEATFSRMFEAHVLVAPTTTLAHSAAFDALMTEKDAVVLDHQVHQSVHMAANVARARGVHVEMVRHEELESASAIVSRLAQRYRTVWFCTDGVLSMYGDLVPFGFLDHILSLAPNVRLYVDDAHGMSWKGKHGRGSFLANMPLTERMVIASSLAKAFGCGGGLLVFSEERERERVRMCGGTLLFSGPLQPPMLGAALASAQLHLTAELIEVQDKLRDRVVYTNEALKAAQLPLLVENDVPIRFVRLGLPRVANEVAERVSRDGVYVNVSMFPTVPMRRAGIRLAINACHEFSEIDRLIESLARHVPAVLAEEGMQVSDLDRLFARAVQSRVLAGATRLEPRSGVSTPGATPAVITTPVLPLPAPARLQASRTGGLTVEHVRTIDDIDATEWNRLLGSCGMISAAAMACAERTFSNQPLREHNWKFDYVVIRDEDGAPVCATVFQTALQKDDFIMRDAVSREVERQRSSDPYFLTSLVVMSGTTLSEGHHVYLDRRGPWREAIRLLTKKAFEIYDREHADVVMFRDFPADDAEMAALMLDEGLLSVPMLDSHVLPITWSDSDGLVARLGPNSRPRVRKLLREASNFEIQTYGAAAGGRRPPPAALDHLWSLYRNLVRRKFRINIFELPSSLLGEMLNTPAWELATLTLKPSCGGPAHGRPVAWFASHMHDGHYAALVAGLDYDYVVDHGVYRQLLLQVILRAQALGMNVIHLGMDADFEKARYKTTVVRNCVYTQAREHFNSAMLREIVADIGTSPAPSPTSARSRLG